jgi:hypothetical protein
MGDSMSYPFHFDDEGNLLVYLIGDHVIAHQYPPFQFNSDYGVLMAVDDLETTNWIKNNGENVRDGLGNRLKFNVGS